MLETRVGVAEDQSQPAQTATDELAQELKPELMVLGRTDVDANHLTLATRANSDRDQYCHRDHPAVLPHLLEGGVQEQVWELAIEPTSAEGMNLRIELLAIAADLVLGDALDTECLVVVVNRSGRDAVEVRLLHDRQH